VRFDASPSIGHTLRRAAHDGANHSPDNQHDLDEIFDRDPITRAAKVLVLLQITSRRGA
jgi:hypothetical protein